MNVMYSSLHRCHQVKFTGISQAVISVWMNGVRFNTFAKGWSLECIEYVCILHSIIITLTLTNKGVQCMVVLLVRGLGSCDVTCLCCFITTPLCPPVLFLIQSKTYDSVTDKFMDFSFEKVTEKLNNNFPMEAPLETTSEIQLNNCIPLILYPSLTIQN